MLLRFLLPALVLTPALLAQSYSSTTIAGTTVIRDGIPAREAFLRGPTSVAADSRGNLYIADWQDNRIRKIGADGLLTTIAGTGVAGFSADGTQASIARLNQPLSLAIDRAGNTLYFSESGNLRIRRINLTTGELSTVAGNGTARSSGDGELATRAGISPFTITLDSTGNFLYICEAVNARVRRVDLTSGIISTFAGNGTPGFGGDNQPAPNAQLAIPQSVAVNADFAYIADWGTSLIRRVDLKTNIISTWGGCGIPADFGDNGPIGRACLTGPDFLHMDPDGNLLIIDSSKIRMVAAGSDVISSIAGAPTIGFAGDGTNALSSARFAIPGAIISPRRGEYIIADTGNFRVRRILNGDLNTIAGSGAVDGRVATATTFNLPSAVTRDAAGNIYIADHSNHRIRKIAAGTNIVTTIAGTGVRGSAEGRINGPLGIASTPEGIVYFSDTGNHRIYRIAPDGIRLIAGATNGASGFSGDGQSATAARFRRPRGLALDTNGNLFIADFDNGRVRRINASDNVISTVAGSGPFTASGDGGPAIAAGLSPTNIAVDTGGNLYISDDINSRVRKVTAGTNVITTILGSSPGYFGDGGPADRARIAFPQGLALDAQGNLFVTDLFNFNVRRVDARTNIVTTIAGSGQSRGEVETGPALGTNMVPIDIAAEPAGNLLVVDSINDRVRRLTPLIPRNLVIVSGNDTTGTPGSQVLLTVKVTDAAGANVAGVLVNFVLASGDATIRPAASQTGIDGTAAVQVTLGEQLGPVTVRAESAGLTAVVFTVTTVTPLVTKLNPVISAVTGISGLGTTLSMNSLAVIEGTELSSATSAKVVETAADLVEGKLPTSFNRSCVEVSGVRAPLLSASASRIVFQTPAVPSPAASVRVIAGCGSANEFVSEVKEVATAAASPEFFLAQGTVVAAVNLATGAPVTTVQPGDDLIVYLAGLGATDTPVEPGAIVADNYLVSGEKTLTLDGNPVDVIYAGTTAEFPGANVLGSSIAQNAGVFQVLFKVPQEAAEGDLPIRFAVGENSSPAGTVLRVRKAPEAVTHGTGTKAARSRER